MKCPRHKWLNCCFIGLWDYALCALWHYGIGGVTGSISAIRKVLARVVSFTIEIYRHCQPFFNLYARNISNFKIIVYSDRENGCRHSFPTALRISISFHIEWDMIVVTVFLSIMVTVFHWILNQMEFHLVQNRKEKCHHDHIPFNVKGIGSIVFSV